MTEATFATLSECLAAGREASGVPGCAAAVYHRGRVYEAAAGVLDFETHTPVSVDSIFQIGSITKSFTATLAMMLVAEGRLELDTAITRYLPDFRLAVPCAADRITVRQLLCHTSGIDGDLIEDTGNEDDCIERFVARLAEVGLLHEPGRFFSYCNVGYIVLGRIIEIIEGLPFENVLRARLLDPLGLVRAVLRAQDAERLGAATGHEGDGAMLRHAAMPYSPRSNGPSGTTLGMSARDLLTFARFHKNTGVSTCGERLLPAPLASAMRKTQVQTPLSSRYTSWGLGWMQYYWNGADTFGHDGGWAGMSAYLRISARHDFAAVLLANGPGSARLYQEVMEPVLLAGTGSLPPVSPEAPSQSGFDLTTYCGRYARHGQYIDIELEDGGLKATLAGTYQESGIAFEVKLCDRDRARCGFPGLPQPVSGYFLEFDQNGRPVFFHVTERAFRRIT